MTRKGVAAAAFALIAVVLATGASAGANSAKQRVATGGAGYSGFRLAPLTAGALTADTGGATFYCWKTRDVVRDGEAFTVTNRPLMRTVGQHRTLEAKNHMEWLAVPRGYELLTRTRMVVPGTGAYAGLAAGGRVAGIRLAGGETK
jgi:hypothetical protein